MVTPRRKVLGFDSWTRGAHHFSRLVPAFRDRGLSLALVHLGSWGNEVGVPREFTIGDLTVRDITFYGAGSISHFLDVEQPDAVVFLSTRTFAHRALLRYCRQRSIPTLHLYHGLVSIQATDQAAGSKRIAARAYAAFVLSRLAKFASRVGPTYAKALAETHASLFDWARFLTDAVGLAVGRGSLRASDDARTTRCAVYTEADVDHAMRSYGFAYEAVTPVGNPDLIRFGFSEDLLGLMMARTVGAQRALMYINTGALASGRVFTGGQAFLRHLVSTEQALRIQGYDLLFKPHHSVSTELLAEISKRTNIRIVQNEQFISCLKNCDGVIVETTTLAMVPALMGLPVLLGQYGDLCGIRFGQALTSYPRAHPLLDIHQASETLYRDVANCDSTAVWNWIEANVGPMPPGKMPERVAKIVMDMLQASSVDNRDVLPDDLDLGPR